MSFQVAGILLLGYTVSAQLASQEGPAQGRCRGQVGTQGREGQGLGTLT